ncbi:cellulase family glycosylhydrolase [Cesiribacter sp. SM1]|uniref:cellulase family glycosylhydrolase n=1 Tax=Cesiribacter sp. SM1 TaxID=2861196 RepID=UPI001CD4CDBA|nr:cellulase family glycosylhydrolase [Cesiribacter sp. SM1]
MKYYSSDKSGNLNMIRCILLLLCLLAASPGRAQQAPFQRGVNLSNWFQAPHVRQIQFARYTKQDFEQIRSLGCDVIRLPINLHYMTNGAPGYTIDPLFFEFMDEVAGWAHALDLHLILDNHSFDPAVNTDPGVGSVLEKVWAQMALHYKDHPAKLYYEILNEPHGIADAQWNPIQQKAIDAIRRYDTRHTIVVGAANWNSYHNLANLPVYQDDNLLYTFHFYDPFLFTHQGASWTDPSMEALAGMPFPYRAADMPPFPDALKGSWLENAYNNYHNEATLARVQELIDIAANFQQQRGVPVFCGEFGVYMPNSPVQDRVYWYKEVRSYMEEKGIAWTSWDYHGGYGLFKAGGSELFDHDLNLPLLEALGLQVPAQTEYIKKPLTDGFAIYTDYLGPQIVEATYGNGLVDYYAADKPNNGQYTMAWEGADQYNSIVLDFRPDKDLSQLVAAGYALDFIFRAAAPVTSFDIRFIDSKTTDPEDLPWRSRITIDESRTAFDSRWHHLHIPLSQFSEQGTWHDNAWHNPEGKFDWSAIDRLEITAEHAPLGDTKLWFDNLYITNADTARILETAVFTGEGEEDDDEGGITGLEESVEKLGISIYPNPGTNYLVLESSSADSIKIEMLDAQGRQCIIHRFKQSTKLELSSLPAGLYLIRLTQSSGRHATYRFVKR